MSNPDRLRQSLNRRSGHGYPSGGSEVCERIYKEKASGGRWDLLELQRLLDQLCTDGFYAVFQRGRNSHFHKRGHNTGGPPAWQA